MSKGTEVNCHFKTSERGSERGGDFEPWIYFEADDAPGFPKMILGLSLRPGSTMDEGHEIAAYLNQRTAQKLSITILD